MKFRSKLALGFTAVVTLLVVANSLVSLKYVNNLYSRLRSSFADSVVPLRRAELADKAFDHMEIQLQQALLEEGPARARAISQFEAAELDFEKWFSEYEQTATNEPAMQALLARTGALDDQTQRQRTALAGVNRNYPLLKRASQEVITLVKAGRDAEALRQYREMQPLFFAIDHNTDALMGLEVEQGKFLDRESQVVARSANQHIPLIAGAAMILGVLLVWIVARSVTEPLLRLTAAAEKVRAGNLDHAVEVESRDEVGRLASAFNEMTASLRGTRAELEGRVEARTRDLANANELLNAQMAERERAAEDLERAKNAAESASRAKSEFLAKMSHEIRTPMNGVMLAVELALNFDVQPELREYLLIAKTSTDSLLHVINDILEFSRAESGKLQFQKIDFYLRESVADALTALSVRAEEKGLRMSCNVDPEIPEIVVGDPGRLQQVLLNLVGNAIKFTEKGGVSLEVSQQARSNHEVTLHFAIHDTGIGVSAEDRDRIFRPFEQADGSITRKYGGTGLGLAISSQLVDIMGGGMWVDSELGQGSTFHFTARFGISATQELPPPAPEEAETWTEPSVEAGSPPLRILVAEDNAINRKIAVRVLESWGHSVAVADNGREALRKFEQEPFDLALMDLQMPEMSGFEATRAIREKEKATGEHLPIIAITAHALEADRAHCFEVGMDGYISKPLDRRDLFEKIRAVAAPNARNRAKNGEPMLGCSGQNLGFWPLRAS